MSEQYQLELIRSYASSGFAAVIAINSGALIAGLSQAGNLLEVFPPAAIAFAVFIWALGVATGVATWGALLAGLFTLFIALDVQAGAARWAGQFGAAAAAAALALYGVLQAVDGIALKQAVNAWASAPDAEKAARFATLPSPFRQPHIRRDTIIATGRSKP